MRLFFLSLAIMFLALTIRSGPSVAPFAAAVAVEADPDEPWYAPAPEDFRPLYDRDAANRAKQSWDQYWSWIKVYYEGNWISHGWSQRAKGLIAVVKSEAGRKTVRAMLNALGKEIGGEWAKHDEVRKVGSADLLAWGKTLEKAKAIDDGTGRQLQTAIDAVRVEHRKKRGGQPRFE